MKKIPQVTEKGQVAGAEGTTGQKEK